ncbi:MAG: hypothetical protein K2Y22_09125 [Candidatus Obscuribacterales bacterium]|nr:hypothetical protein [Candidatus Obscuribacterales bacterium]
MLTNRQLGITLSLTLMIAVGQIGAVGAAPTKAPAKTPARPAAKPAAAPAKKPETPTTAVKTEPPKVEPVLENVMDVTPDDLVNKPHEYLNKNVKFQGDFSSFSSLALDYKPAMKPSKSFLSFLIFKKDTHVPLSELKMAMAIPKEKDPDNTLLATLKEGDQLELVGKVFSAALDDPWVEIFKVKKLNAKPDEPKEGERKAAADGQPPSPDVAKDKEKNAQDEAKKRSDVKPSETKNKGGEHVYSGKPGIKVAPGNPAINPIPADVVDGKKPAVLDKNAPPAVRPSHTIKAPVKVK